MRLVLDDFGAGYASISYLREMKFDAIKLDGSLVATVAHWVNIPLRDDKPDFTPVDPAGARRSLQVHFVEGDPLEVWEAEQRLAADLAASGIGSVAFAAPFLATEIGTDRYVDELW